MQECARYLETYKVYETKNADSILGRTDEDYLSRLNAAFTSVRGVNKTDVLTLATSFKTAAGMMQASMEDMTACPGIGPTKASHPTPMPLSPSCHSPMHCVHIACSRRLYVRYLVLKITYFEIPWNGRQTTVL